MTGILLTILCSTTIALLLKYNDTKIGQPLVLLAGNYLTASLISLLLMVSQPQSGASVRTLFFGMAVAVVFSSSFFAFARAVAFSGTALAQTSSRLSVAIPVILSLFVFKESPSIRQIAGIGLAFFTIFLFYKSLRKRADGVDHGLAKYMYLLLLLLGIGIGDFSMKLFQEIRPIIEKPFFLFIIFTYSFLICSSILLFKKIKVKRHTFYLGMVLGIPNIFSSYFILTALATTPAVVVYPFVNIGIIVLTTLSAYALWKEHLDTWGIISLLTGLGAIVLLSM